MLGFAGVYFPLPHLVRRLAIARENDGRLELSDRLVAGASEGDGARAPIAVSLAGSLRECGLAFRITVLTSSR